MSASSYLESVWSGSAHPPAPLRVLLGSLSRVYGSVVSRRAAAYLDGSLEAERAPVPVVSVGNLTVGGSGKTPLVVWLAEGLKHRGLRPTVVSRGYGGRRRASVIDPGGRLSADPDACGDEAVLVAERTACPVVTSADRLVACRIAEKRFAPDVVLLDDGFQHQRLARDLDVVVLGGAEPGAKLLPAGPLREPLSALGRADVLIDTAGALAELAATALE